MFRIEARGIRMPLGEVHVVCKGLTVTCKATGGVPDEWVSRALNDELDRRHVMGGTFYPKRDSGLNYYNVLQNHFFDEIISLEVKGDIGSIPWEPDRIY